jgi:hypothetical protein
LIKSPNSALEVEELLRSCAPALPLALKKRTLHHCATRARERQQRYDRLHWQMTWAAAAILALQAVTVFMVDTQNTRLISGDSQPTPYAPITIAEVTALCQQRSRQIALMTGPSKLG